MIKHMLVGGILSIVATYVIATPIQCPVSGNFTHTPPQNWHWQESYANWWDDFSGSNTSPLQTLPDDFTLTVVISPSHQIVECNYGTSDQRQANQLVNFDIGSNSAVSTVPKELPPYFIQTASDTYQCQTYAATAEQCTWQK